jgi:DNA-binding NarL/FixJ family response regulator
MPSYACCDVSVFVGRGDELATLEAVAGATAAAQVAAAVVVGDPGTGKSRLLAEVAVPRRTRGFRIVGYEPERHVPLAATTDLLRALSDATPAGGRLQRLAFEAREEESALEPMRVFEAAHRALELVGPALLLVDDLQWVDELSLALCHYLVRAAETEGGRLAVIAVARPSLNATSFEESLRQVLPPARLTRLELGPLAPADARELAKALGQGIDDDAARELAERSGGSPFWLEVLARAGGIDVDAGRLVTARLRGASPDASALLALVAVAARPLALADAALLESWDPERAEHAAAELVARGIAVESAGTVRLAHDLIRAAAAAEIPEERRRDVHRRLGDWLARIAGSDVRRLREALGHGHEAGRSSLDLAHRLVRSPQRTLLGSDGLRLLEAIADEADPFAADVLTLHEEIASLATEVAEHEQALARWSLVADRADEPLRRASASLEASRAAYQLTRPSEARELLERSREIDARNEILLLEQTTQEAAILLWLEQRTTDGRTLAREAVTQATDLAARSGGVAALDAPGRRAYVDALRLEYEGAVIEGDLPALLRAAEGRESAARGFDLESYLTASLAVALGLRYHGRVAEAIARARRVWAEAHRRVLPRLIVDAGFFLARTLEVSGDLAEAEIVVGRTSEVATRAGDVPRARHRLLRVELEVAFQRGQPHDALRRLEETEEPNEHQRIMLHGDRALWYGRLNGAAAAPRVLEEIADGQGCADVVACKRCEAELVLFSAEALARIGHRDEARAALARWEALAIHEALDDLAYVHARALADVDPSARSAALQAALEIAAASPFGLAELWIRLDLGRELAAAGSDDAVAELERVVTVASDRGATTVVELAEQALRSLGVRTWRRGAAAKPLTEREQEIVRLIAAGASNPEIAQRLFLSRKTIERHVSNVLRKVGARNRAELAARVAELDVEGAHR